MVKLMAETLTDQGIKVNLVNLGSDKHDFRVPVGMVLAESVLAGALIMASPTVLGGAHPLAAAMTMLVGGLNPPIRYFGIVGSYGWGSQMEKQLGDLMARHKAERLETLLVKGLPTKEDEDKIRVYASELADKLKAIPQEEVLEDC